MTWPVALTVSESAGVARDRQPVVSGVPFTAGALKSLDELCLLDEADHPVPAQFKTLSTWEDGSPRWVLVSFADSAKASEAKQYRLDRSAGRAAVAPDASVTITESDDVFTVDTGRVRFDIPIYSHSIMRNIQRKDGAQWKSVSKRGLEAVVWRTGVKPFFSRVEDCTIEDEGPLRSVIKIEGHHLMWDPQQDEFDPSEAPSMAFIMRVFCLADSDEIRLQYTFINDNRDELRRASERYHVYALEELRDFKWANGRWVERPPAIRFREQELLEDDYGQLNVKTIKLRLWLDDAHEQYEFGVAGGNPVGGTIDGPVALQQVGPVGAYDEFFGELPYPHTSFGATVMHGRGEPVQRFDKAAGWVTMGGPGGTVALGSKYFWQYHPKIIALDTQQLELHVWNKLEDLPDPEIGFAKTHEVSLRFGAPAKAPDMDTVMAALHHPLRAVAAPQQYIGSDVFGTFSPADTTRWGGTEASWLQATRNAETARDKANLYGVRDYGDTLGIRFDTPVWWNQEYDVLLGATLQFARTAERDYLDEADVLAWHFMDVDVLHASNSPLDEGGQHMHFTDHAKGETHAGHGTVEGLWHYYMMTGEPRAREVAEGIGDFFARIAAWKDFLDYRDDEERTIGWALKALVASFRATRNPRYQLGAQMIIEQALAGQDPDTGNWDHPLYPNEDEHRPVCIGGKPWMVGIVLEGMKHYHCEFNDPRVAEMITKATDWIIWSEYRYMTCNDRDTSDGSSIILSALSYSWELTQKRYYIDEALRIFAASVVNRSAENAGSGCARGSEVEPIANMMRLVEQKGDEVWRDGEPVIDPSSDKAVKALRADPKFRAKPQKRR